MNQDQAISLFRSILKLVGALAIAKGFGDSAAWEIIVGGLSTLIGLFLSHIWHSDAPASAAPVKLPSNVVKLALVLFCLAPLLFGCASLTKAIDPALPGQTAAAPFLAFANGNAYLLGHPATSNQVYTAVRSGTVVGVEALVKESPGATNYLPDVHLAFEYFADSGTYSQSELSAVLGQIQAGDGEQAIVNSLANAGLSLAGTYIAPLENKDTNAAPFLKAALHGIADGVSQ